MPDFLCDELKDYISRLYGLLPTDRIFHLTKSFLHHEMTRGAEKAGVKRIRIHDLRHSHISLLISMGFSAVSIGNRVGHESVDITYRYAHMFATVYKGNLIKNLIMDCQSYTKYRPNETTGGIFVSWRRKEELPTGA